ncbi:MAG: YpmA family protein [Peptococcaceae bacterium]|nr:YpmA family protein [Peptococcaceae bacterium]
MDNKTNDQQLGNMNPGKLELIATQKFTNYSEMYKVIDFLNRNLKQHHLLFGLTKSNDSMVISVYEVE